jgi:hypothetical protein
MELADIVKKLAIGTVIYGALSTAPVDRNIAKVESPLDYRRAVTIGPATESFNPYTHKWITLQEPAKDSQAEQEEIQPTKEAIDRWNSIKQTSWHVLYYPLGELGYAESNVPFLIPTDWIIQIKVPHGYTVQQWFDDQKRKPDMPYSKDLMQRMLLAVNLPKLYPKDFPKKFSLWHDDIVLPEGEMVNFIDFGHKGSISGIIGKYLPKEEAEKILGLKNDRGELKYGTDRR